MTMSWANIEFASLATAALTIRRRTVRTIVPTAHSRQK